MDFVPFRFRQDLHRLVQPWRVMWLYGDEKQRNKTIIITPKAGTVGFETACIEMKLVQFHQSSVCTPGLTNSR